MSIASLTTRFVFGIKGDISDNICYLDEQTIVFPSGSNCILYNIDQKTQRFIPGTDKSPGISSMAVSPNRRYIAIAERGDKAIITIFDLHTLRKRKVLTYSDGTATEFVSLAFSPDSKYLISQGGKPDWILLYWTWEKAKIMALTKSSNQNVSPVHQVSFNPQDNTQLCVVGQGIFKLFRYSEGNLKQFAFQKLDPQNFLCHTWLSDEKIVAGTDTGRLLLFESGELRNELHISAPSSTSAFKAPGAMSVIPESSSTQDLRPQVTSIAAFSKGFVCAGGAGFVHLFEKTDDKDGFKKSRQIKVPVDSQSPDPEASIANQIITTLAVSPSEETLVCSTKANQMYSITMSSTDLGKGDQITFELLSQSFHNGVITGLDICIRKPLVATCSIDRSVRVWNYETCSLELSREFQEECYSIALHPSGLYILVGFSDKLRLMNLLIDEIRMFKEFTIRGCRECSFSNGGHYFATVHGNVIQLYSTMTFENVGNLKGHNGKVRAVIWSQDDTKIISCGMDGAVYEWNVYTGKRDGESVLKSCSYTGVAVSPDGRTTFAVGSDKTLKEICDSQILREVSSSDMVLTQVSMSRSGRMLFVATKAGTVRAMKFPLTVPGEWQEYHSHCGTVTKMRISFDDQYLFTVGEDACLFIYKVTEKEGRGLKREKEIVYAEEILITKSDLEEKNSMMAELKTRVEELKMENEYQLRLKDMNYNEKIKELTEKFIQEMESLKTKNQVLKTDKEKEEAKHEEEVSDIREKHSRELQDLESANNQKLMSEYEKYQELQSKSQKMQEDYDRQLEEMESSKEQALSQLTEYFETKLQEKSGQLEQSQDESRQQVREHEETKRQIEEDADREILDIKNKYERRLREEKEQNLRLKGETGIMRKKFTSLQKEIDDYKAEIQRLHGEHNKLQGVIKSLEKDIYGLKKEIQERDETIQDKEKRIYDLKKKNQELEKFKFVLDYKIKELKKQIEPRENDIKAMKEQIQEMESELERFHKRNTSLELNIDVLRQKLKATDKEMHMERQKVNNVEAVVKRFKTELYNCVGYIQEPKKLKESVKQLYQKYAQENTNDSSPSVDVDMQEEYARQREHLERSVASLRKKLEKDNEIHRADNVRIMQENVTLIKEINDLRRELKISRTQVHDLETALGVMRRSQGGLSSTVKSAPNKKKSSRDNAADDLEKIITIQKSEIRKLREQIHDLENQTIKAPSGGRLPPVPVS